ncbi:helix-turn-helix domain-containing protein [Leptolyngbya sp. FACHB-261]|uniref:helix-turn-helix domain-containing protein n=1 Tax=Leptolyngbya sp. FACHB-261 TaxID=2692806 RepID=UPI00168A15C8|nr:AraC family transcriptional regulator [Leptolyngbya sp. FACHB-261]MBD2102405.1 helix-turn-helix transcriptional regulator [Leptolyngbya sp. FACHB-261]
MPYSISSASNSAESIQNTSLVLPREPTISSAKANWNNILLVHHLQPATSVAEHCLPYHQVCIKLGKPYRLEQVIDGYAETVEAIPGGIGLYLANLSQSFSWDGEAEFLQLYIAPELLRQTSEEIWDASVDLIPQPALFIDPLILQIGLALKTILETEDPASHLYADSMIHTLVTHLLFRYSAQKSAASTYLGSLSQQQLNHVIDYIHGNLERKISLVELAGIVKLSPYHFARLFKQSTGLPPHQYQIKCRIDRAKDLLKTNLALADIAQIVGFSSQGHLNYHFKRLVGITPKAFLRR